MELRGRRRRITGMLVVHQDDDRGTPRHRLEGQGALGRSSDLSTMMRLKIVVSFSIASRLPMRRK